MVLDGRMNRRKEWADGRTHGRRQFENQLLDKLWCYLFSLSILSFSETKVKHMYFVFYVDYKYKTKQTCNMQDTYENL